MTKFGDLIRGKASTPVPTPVPVVEETPPRPEEEVAAAVASTDESEVNFSAMSKKELERYGRTLGIELDRRHSKADLIEELKGVL